MVRIWTVGIWLRIPFTKRLTNNEVVKRKHKEKSDHIDNSKAEISTLWAHYERIKISVFPIFHYATKISGKKSLGRR